MTQYSRVSLNTCDAHVDCIVVYHGTKCPLCTAESELERAEEELIELEKIRDELS